MAVKKNIFIEQTAFDYDLSYDTVLNIYKKWNAVNLFYEKLEEEIKLRRV